MKQMQGSLIYALALILIAPICAPGADWYVRKTFEGASDSNPGTKDKPFASITHAVVKASGGDTIWVGDGVYHEGDFWEDTPSGTEDNWTVFRNMPGESPVLDGQNKFRNAFDYWERGFIEYNGFEARNYTMAGVANHSGVGDIRVRNMTVHHCAAVGIAMNHSDSVTNMLVEDCVAYLNGYSNRNSWASGIHLNNKGQGGVSHVIRRNICYQNYDDQEHTDGNGIMFDVGGGGYCLIENNLCFNNGAGGINVLHGEVHIINNTCFRNAWDPEMVDWKGRPRRAGEIMINVGDEFKEQGNASIVRNNIFWAREMFYTNGIEIVNCEPTFENNLFWNDSGKGFNLPERYVDCRVVDPMFESAPLDNDLSLIIDFDDTDKFLAMDYEDYDFTPKADSPAIDAGSPNKAPKVDVFGNPRPVGSGYDIGAIERQDVSQ